MMKRALCLMSLWIALVGVAGSYLHGQSEEGRSYVNAVLDAYGSTAAVQSLHNYHLQGEITLWEGKSSTTGQVEVYYKKPDRYKRVVTVGAREENTGYRGTDQWSQVREVGAVTHRRRLDRAEGSRLARWQDGELVNVLAMPFGGLQVDLLEDPYMLDNTEYTVVKIWQERDDSRWIKLLVDPKTRLIRRVEMYLEDASRNEYTERILEFLDYDVRGPVQFPGRIREFINGRLVSEIQVTSVTFNTSMSDNVFRP